MSIIPDLNAPGVVEHFKPKATAKLPTEERKSRFIRASDLEGRAVPVREELVRGLIPMATITLVGGDGGTGKSLLLLQLACSTALGRPWLNQPVKDGPVLFISAEDDEDELHIRLATIAAAEGVGLGELHRLTIRSLAGEDALLATLDSRNGTLTGTELLDEIDRLMDQIRPVLVVLDTLADMNPGNENDRSQARQFIGKLRGPAIKYRSAIVVLAHPSLTGISSGTGTSGSTGWSNSVRSRLYLERVTNEGFEANPDARRLSVKKANYARIGTEISLTWQNGVFVADTTPTSLDKTISNNKAERIFLELLAQFTDQGRYVSAQPSNNYAPKLFSESPHSQGLSKRAFTTAMNMLFTAGTIEIQKHGPKSRERSHIAMADPVEWGGSGDEK
ncbi:AAA family ATPase [Aestuariivirga sp.]|uniref:AAA family ATPase n=1 Tax=Aestuariivirga sp. TaxID=2650926 RepID=UPI003593F90C